MSFFSDDMHATILVSTELALDANGRFLAFRVRSAVNLGAYLSATGIHSSINNIGGIAGVYKIAAIHAEIRDYFSHSNPIAAYRGSWPSGSVINDRTDD